MGILNHSQMGNLRHTIGARDPGGHSACLWGMEVLGQVEGCVPESLGPQLGMPWPIPLG